MANTKKYFTEEEKHQGKLQNHKDWRDRNPEKYKTYCSKKEREAVCCKICGVHVKHMAQHKRTLKHQNNINENSLD